MNSTPAMLSSFVVLCAGASFGDEPESLPSAADKALHKAGQYFRANVATHGGYVYFYSLDFQQRWGEGLATPTQVWIQPPGTPTVGLAFVRAYEATGDRQFLDAARDAAVAVSYGQLKSGGWTNLVDFDPKSRLAGLYRNGRGRGKNNSSLDDGQTQAALRLLMHVDRVLKFQDKQIHDAAVIGLDALLKAQFPNGGFPQVWDDKPNPRPPLKRANYPTHDWRTEGRIKEYWDMYTLNDNVAGYVADTLIDAHAIYGEQRFLSALERLGDFLILAQMPEPQPAWAQQYNYDMQPIWARKFEPAAIAGDESQEVIATLMKISTVTKKQKYLEPIPRALAYLTRSLLKDGRLARYYELQTNRPLYMVRQGKQYSLTNDDSNLPAHYGWKRESRLKELAAQYEAMRSGAAKKTAAIPIAEVAQVASTLDQQGRWVSTYNGERLVGQAKLAVGAKYLSSEVFAHNVTLLSEYLISRQAN